MQEARCRFAIEIDLVTVRNYSQLRKIEIGIQTLKGIEGPGDSLESLRKDSLAPRQLLCSLPTSSTEQHRGPQCPRRLSEAPRPHASRTRLQCPEWQLQLLR